MAPALEARDLYAAWCRNVGDRTWHRNSTVEPMARQTWLMRQLGGAIGFDWTGSIFGSRARLWAGDRLQQGGKGAFPPHLPLQQVYGWAQHCAESDLNARRDPWAVGSSRVKGSRCFRGGNNKTPRKDKEAGQKGQSRAHLRASSPLRGPR